MREAFKAVVAVVNPGSRSFYPVINHGRPYSRPGYTVLRPFSNIIQRHVSTTTTSSKLALWGETA